MTHPREMGASHVEAFLSHLANERNVSPSTHRQALSALLFLYGEVLKVDLPWLEEIGRPALPNRRHAGCFNPRVLHLIVTLVENSRRLVKVMVP